MTHEESLIVRVRAYCRSFLARSIYGECKAFCPFSDSELLIIGQLGGPLLAQILGG